MTKLNRFRYVSFDPSYRYLFAYGMAMAVPFHKMAYAAITFLAETEVIPLRKRLDAVSIENGPFSAPFILTPENWGHGTLLPTNISIYTPLPSTIGDAADSAVSQSVWARLETRLEHYSMAERYGLDRNFRDAFRTPESTTDGRFVILQQEAIRVLRINLSKKGIAGRETPTEKGEEDKENIHHGIHNEESIYPVGKFTKMRREEHCVRRSREIEVACIDEPAKIELLRGIVPQRWNSL
eukprot:gene6825-4904_t